MDGSRLGDATLGHLVGSLKWFSAEKGYGFVTCNVTGKDALVHQNILYNFGQSSIAKGCAIEALACVTHKGFQIVEILNIQSETAVTGPNSKNVEFQKNIPTATLPARVKWYCKEKNYGFVNVFDDARDCFLHAKTLGQAGLGPVTVGEALRVEVSDDPGGRVVVSVQPWA